MAEAEVLEVEAPVEEGAPEVPSQPESLVGALSGLSPELQAQLDAVQTPEPVATEEQDTPSEPEAPTDLMPQWVNDTLSNPKAISQVPRSQQGAVIEAMKSQWVAQANEYGRQMFQQGQTAAQEMVRAEARRAELEAMQEDDPSGFIAWQKENPLEAAKFLQGQAPAPAVRSTADIEAEAAQELAKLDAYPEAKAQIFAHPEKYPPTAAGLRALVRDVALAEAKTTTPARQQAEQRQQAAVALKAAPKADIAGGASANGAFTAAQLKDIAKLPFEEQMKALEGKSRQEIDAAARGLR